MAATATPRTYPHRLSEGEIVCEYAQKLTKSVGSAVSFQFRDFLPNWLAEHVENDSQHNNNQAFEYPCGNTELSRFRRAT
jgi:hypothetical protein